MLVVSDTDVLYRKAPILFPNEVIGVSVGSTLSASVCSGVSIGSGGVSRTGVHSLLRGDEGSGIGGVSSAIGSNPVVVSASFPTLLPSSFSFTFTFVLGAAFALGSAFFRGGFGAAVGSPVAFFGALLRTVLGFGSAVSAGGTTSSDSPKASKASATPPEKYLLFTPSLTSLLVANDNVASFFLALGFFSVVVAFTALFLGCFFGSSSNTGSSSLSGISQILVGRFNESARGIAGGLGALAGRVAIMAEGESNGDDESVCMLRDGVAAIFSSFRRIVAIVRVSRNMFKSRHACRSYGNARGGSGSDPGSRLGSTRRAPF